MSSSKLTSSAKLWLLAAGAVAAITVALVLLFGITSAPDFPSLYEAGAPTVEGTLAYVDYGPDQCVHVFEVASGESREVYCDNWLHLEGWDSDGNLRIHSGNGREYVSVVDPATGEVLEWGDFVDGDVPPPPFPHSLRARSREGHVTLFYSRSGEETTLIETTGPRDYGLWEYGIITNQEFAWVYDSEDRVLVVPLDGSGGPWVVTEGVSEPMWK